MTIEHRDLGNVSTKMHGIVWQTVANAAALAALVIVAADIAQRKVVLQTDTGQLWVPLTVAPTFQLVNDQTASLGNGILKKVAGVLGVAAFAVGVFQSNGAGTDASMGTLALDGANVAAGPANTFLKGTGAANTWATLFTTPANPGDTGKVTIASAGDFSYLGGTTTGNMLNWNGAAWVAGVDFGALNPVTTGGFLANLSTGFIRLGLASGSGAGVASAASAGSIRGPRGASVFTINVRNNGDTADLTLLATDTVSGPAATLGSTAVGGFSTVIAAPSAGTITLRVGSSATQLQLTTSTISSLIPSINFFSTVTNGTFGYQSDATNGVTGKKLFNIGQDCGGTTTTGGAFDTRPGSGTTAGGLYRIMSGGGAVASAQRFAANDTGIGLYTATPVAQAARAGQLTDSTTGTPSTTLVDVGVAFSQANVNNNFASVLTKLNAIDLLIHNVGVSA